MLTLYLLRHAKAEPASQNNNDEERALTEGGLRDARHLGRHLARADTRLDLVLVSPSKRTQQTLQAVSEAFDGLPARTEPSLYNASLSQLRSLVQGLGGNIQSAMVIGHNPGLAEAAVSLASDGDLVEIMRMRKRFPPCSLAMITFGCESWRDVVAGGGGQLISFSTPDDLTD